MKRKELVSLTNQLHRQRAALLKTVLDAEADLAAIAEERGSELEERAREERSARLFARLDERGQREIEAIDVALQRCADGTYGVCLGCGEAISGGRLHALPATPHCIECAAELERQPAVETAAPEPPQRGSLPSDLSLLSDRELESSLRDLVRDDGRVDTEELRIVARRGVVYIDGAVPSVGEHQILSKLMTDVAGVREILDRVQVNPLLWDRADRERLVAAPLVLLHPDPEQTEDIVENSEDGVEYSAPGEPGRDEE